MDVKHKLIRSYSVTDAAVHESGVFDELLDEINTSAQVYADSAYRSDASIELLENRGFRERLQRKGCKTASHYEGEAGQEDEGEDTLPD